MTPELMTLIASLTELATGYRDMRDGDRQLGGFCLARANRIARLIDKLNSSPAPVQASPVCESEETHA